jgi:cytochrome c oxidase subunit 4
MERAHPVSGRAYAATWIGLLVLTATSFGVSRLDLGPWDLVAALAIAVVKSGLVLALFMHLVETRLSSRLVVLVAALLVTLLVGLTATDVATRHTYPAAPQRAPL